MTAAVANTLVTRPLPNGSLVEFNTERLDDAHAAGLAEELFAIATACPGRTLYLNFNNVRSVQREVWLQILGLHRELQEEGRRLCILNLLQELKDQFHVIERNEHDELFRPSNHD